MERTLHPANTGRVGNHEDRKRSVYNCSAIRAETRQTNKEGGMMDKLLVTLILAVIILLALYGMQKGE